ncbi:MAG: response regulator [Proteobacteria bacterium]|nr:response regulator [Pseudomonadota bacterium]MBI3498543.1 response regulator [Pseudomonadota bacterium]
MVPRVLVIEDNQNNTDLMVYLIQSAGWRASTAADGEAGLAAIARERPDLVLCDVQLPKIDGFGVVARLKADAALRSIPVVAVTALAMVGDRERAFAAGFDGYMAKPIEPEKFLGSLQEYLPQATMRTTDRTSSSVASMKATASERGRGRILAVDDRADNLDFFGNLLSPHGFEVSCAQDGQEALRMALAAPPDLFLSDMSMPGLDGLDLLAALRAESTLGAIPFLLVSSVPPRELESMLRTRTKPDSVLYQPLDPNQLLAEIDRLLARRPRGDRTP